MNKNFLMTNSDFFLIPIGEILYLANFNNDRIFILNKTILHAKSKYCVSDNGLVASLDIISKLLIVAKIKNSGELEYQRILKTPINFNPKYVSIFENKIVLIGDIDYDRDASCLNQNEIMYEYLLCADEFVKTDVSNKRYKNHVGASFVENNFLHIINTEKYENKNSYSVFYKRSIIRFNSTLDLRKVLFTNLKEDRNLDKVLKFSMNEKYIATLSHLSDNNSVYYICLKIFDRNTNKYLTGLSQYFSYEVYSEDYEYEDFSNRYFQDLFFVKDKGVLLIPSLERGLYIYDFEEAITQYSWIAENKIIVMNEDSSKYLNFENKSVSEIIPIPNNKEFIIVVYVDVHNDLETYSYSLEHIDSILGFKNSFIIEAEMKLKREEELYEKMVNFNYEEYEENEKRKSDQAELNGDWGGLYGDEAIDGFWNTQ